MSMLKRIKKPEIKKKHIILLIMLLIPILLIGISNFFFSSASYQRVAGFDMENAINLYPDDVIEISGYAYDGREYTAINHDPQIYFFPPEHEISSARVLLSRPVVNDHSILVYLWYAPGYEGQSTTFAELPAGSTEVIFNLPTAVFVDMRFDIDIFDEPFEITGIYVSSSPVIYNNQWRGNIDGVIMTLLIGLFITALWITGLYTGDTDRFIETFTTKRRWIKENPKKLLLHFGILIAIVILAIPINYILSMSDQISGRVGNHGVFLFAVSGFSLYFLYHFRGKPDKLFLVLSLLIGFLYVMVTPTFWYGWDQRIHYAWALEESFIFNVSVTEADLLFARSPEYFSFPEMPSAAHNATISTFNKYAGSLAEIGSEGRTFFNRLVHVPAGLGFFIGRSLLLSPNFTFILAAFFSHLSYTVITYLAIRRLNSGKYLMAIIAMIPTAFVLSTTNGYDHWITAFLMLGFAYYFYELQNPDKKIELKSLIIILGSFIIAMGPKEIYFPMMFLLFFIKKDKFQTEKEYRNYIVFLAVAIVLVVASFMIPFIISGGGSKDDFRGGAGVSSSEQIGFIFSNPLAYTVILLKFLLEYINIFTTQDYVTSYAHLGYLPFTRPIYYTVWVLIAFVALTDRVDKDKLTSSIWHKVIMLIISFSTVAIIATSMYIGFTEVGSDVIEGVQGRYLIPMLFPFIYIISNINIRFKFNETVYSTCAFGIMVMFLLLGAFAKLMPFAMLG